VSQVAKRLISLIFMLQSRRTWKAGDLAEELGVSERTVHRYMRNLEDMGIPIYSERGPYGGFSLVRGYKLPPLSFSAEEATVLYMGARLVRNLWGDTYHDAATAVTAKLDNVLPDDLRADVARAQQGLYVGGLTAIDYRPWSPTISTVRQCILRARQLQLVYKSFRQAPMERIVDPYGLGFQWGLWYLVGYCHLRGAVRTFRVDRIVKAESLATAFSRPVGFDLEGHLRRMADYGDRVQVEVALRPEIAPMIHEQFGHWMTLEEQSDGVVMARFETSTLDWATGWALSLGSMAQVRAPDELVKRVQHAAYEVVGLYGPPETKQK